MTKLLDLARASKLMEERGIDILVGTGFVNYGYLTGTFTHFGMDYPGPLYNGARLVRFAGLPQDLSVAPFLITYPGEEGDIIHDESWVEDRRFWGPTYKAVGRGDALEVVEDPVVCLASVLDERGLASSRIGFDFQDISFALLEEIRQALPKAQLVDAHEDFLNLRIIKTPTEIERLKGAVRGVERAHEAVRGALREGITELELAAIEKRAVIDELTDRYIVHVAFGEKGARSLTPTERRLKRGELVSVDAGCVHRSYIGDMFRVFAFGKPPEEAIRVHEIMDRANAAVLRAIRPGVTASSLYDIGAGVVRSNGLDLALDFAGHGIGLDVHEPPYLMPGDETVLQPNMVIVVELSTKRLDLGHISAEIPVLLTDDGCEILTSLPYTLAYVN